MKMLKSSPTEVSSLAGLQKNFDYLKHWKYSANLAYKRYNCKRGWLWIFDGEEEWNNKIHTYIYSVPCGSVCQKSIWQELNEYTFDQKDINWLQSQLK